mmetsp:Transcript_5041/g.16353  ORF Transcript_5041/g.16353 Transcript_5041/m.16353 type:complete len:247 (-) Transcript_5041:120-860(-)
MAQVLQELAHVAHVAVGAVGHLKALEGRLHAGDVGLGEAVFTATSCELGKVGQTLHLRQHDATRGSTSATVGHLAGLRRRHCLRVVVLRFRVGFAGLVLVQGGARWQVVLRRGLARGNARQDAHGPALLLQLAHVVEDLLRHRRDLLECIQLGSILHLDSYGQALTVKVRTELVRQRYDLPRFRQRVVVVGRALRLGRLLCGRWVGRIDTVQVLAYLPRYHGDVLEDGHVPRVVLTEFITSLHDLL